MIQVSDLTPLFSKVIGENTVLVATYNIETNARAATYRDIDDVAVMDKVQKDARAEMVQTISSFYTNTSVNIRTEYPNNLLFHDEYTRTLLRLTPHLAVVSFATLSLLTPSLPCPACYYDLLTIENLHFISSCPSYAHKPLHLHSMNQHCITTSFHDFLLPF